MQDLSSTTVGAAYQSRLPDAFYQHLGLNDPTSSYKDEAKVIIGGKMQKRTYGDSKKRWI